MPGSSEEYHFLAIVLLVLAWKEVSDSTKREAGMSLSIDHFPDISGTTEQAWSPKKVLHGFTKELHHRRLFETAIVSHGIELEKYSKAGT